MSGRVIWQFALEIIVMQTATNLESGDADWAEEMPFPLGHLRWGDIASKAR